LVTVNGQGRWLIREELLLCSTNGTHTKKTIN
jgi:hypothetical protein